jgi:hypothetical protein
MLRELPGTLDCPRLPAFVFDAENTAIQCLLSGVERRDQIPTVQEDVFDTTPAE